LVLAEEIDLISLDIVACGSRPNILGSGSGERPSNIFWLKNSKENALWCYSVVHSINIVCLQCGLQCKYYIYSTFIVFFLGSGCGARPSNTFWLKNRKDNATWCYNIVHNVMSLCPQYFHSVFPTRFKV
jgi:hypothetical protein